MVGITWGVSHGGYRWPHLSKVVLQRGEIELDLVSTTPLLSSAITGNGSRGGSSRRERRRRRHRGGCYGCSKSCRRTVAAVFLALVFNPECPCQPSNGDQVPEELLHFFPGDGHWTGLEYRMVDVRYSINQCEQHQTAVPNPKFCQREEDSLFMQTRHALFGTEGPIL